MLQYVRWQCQLVSIRIHPIIDCFYYFIVFRIGLAAEATTQLQLFTSVLRLQCSAPRGSITRIENEIETAKKNKLHNYLDNIEKLAIFQYTILTCTDICMQIKCNNCAKQMHEHKVNRLFWLWIYIFIRSHLLSEGQFSKIRSKYCEHPFFWLGFNYLAPFVSCSRQ